MLEFIQKVLNNSLSEDQKYELLVESNKSDISASELAEIVVLLKKYETVKLDFADAVDVCGTGGSGLSRFNTSTMAAVFLSKLGLKVAKHGNKAASGRFGSFDLLEALGFQIDLTQEEMVTNFEQNNLVFMYAKNIYPIMKEFAGIRQRYGKATIFNILGPLLNPANTKYQIIGCGFADKMELMAQTCKILGREKVLIVRGQDGLDEITLTGSTDVVELNNGEIEKYSLEPEQFGVERCGFEQIQGGDKETNVTIAQAMLDGKGDGRHADLVGINVAAVLKMLAKCIDYKEGLRIFRELV